MRWVLAERFRLRTAEKPREDQAFGTGPGLGRDYIDIDISTHRKRLVNFLHTTEAWIPVAGNTHLKPGLSCQFSAVHD